MGLIPLALHTNSCYDFDQLTEKEIGMETRDKSLYYFTLVAEELNISSVARLLYISQQALSKHIQRLEEELGVTLFNRGKALSLTIAMLKTCLLKNRLFALIFNLTVHAVPASRSRSQLIAGKFLPLLFSNI